MDTTPVLLSDKNCEGYTRAIYHALDRKGYVELLGIFVASFPEVGLNEAASDETVWNL